MLKATLAALALATCVAPDTRPSAESHINVKGTGVLA